MGRTTHRLTVLIAAWPASSWALAKKQSKGDSNARFDPLAPHIDFLFDRGLISFETRAARFSLHSSRTPMFRSLGFIRWSDLRDARSAVRAAPISSIIAPTFS
jgi:hypothetical protein